MPSSNYFLGIDLGTTSVKTTLIDDKGMVIQQQRMEYPTKQIKPMWIEQDPWDWWKATRQVVKATLEAASVESQFVRAVSVSGQAPALLSVDCKGNPIGNAIIWMDRRSEKECEDVAAVFGRQSIKQLSGNRVDPYYLLPKIVWQRKHQCDSFNQTFQYLQANGWIIFLLTGYYSIDATHAALTQLYDIRKNEWDMTLLKDLGLTYEHFPAVFSCTEVVGHVTSHAANEIGLAAGTPVIAGAIDGATAPLGLKLIHGEQVFEMSGQSSGIGIVLDRPVFHDKLALLKHAIDGKWILKGSMSTTGGSLQWFRDQVDGRLATYSDYEKWAGSVPPGARGLLYLPYLVGERAPIWDSYAKGVFFGLHLKTGKQEMIRAIMEGTAYGLRSILEEFRSIPFPVDTIMGTGGGYLSPLWSQIKADILETEIQVVFPELETASLGAAYLAMMSIYSMDAADLPCVPVSKHYLPDESRQTLYRQYYSLFQLLYSQNQELFKTLSLVGEKQWTV